MDKSPFEYAPAPESRALVSIKPQYGLFINGAWVEPKSKTKFATINPATEEVLSKISQASDSDVDRAVKAARAAYTKTWSKMPAKSVVNIYFESLASCKSGLVNSQY
jgi:aldehyde dehydrogenase (NAD+)